MPRTPPTDKSAARKNFSKVSAEEEYDNMIARIRGRNAFYKQPNLSAKRKRAVAKKMGSRDGTDTANQ